MDDWTYTSTTGPRTWRAWTAEPEHVPPALSLTWDKSASWIDIPSIYPHHDISELDWYRLNGIDVKSEEEIPKMEVTEHFDASCFGKRHAVACSYEPDLSQDKILKCISMMKGKLMMQCAPVKVDNIECRMTPAVKHNIIMAYKRLERYGKKLPFVARFDEYGRRLPDEIKIDTMYGMTIKIVDPVDYGPYYLSFEGIVRNDTVYKPSFDFSYDTEDVPF